MGLRSFFKIFTGFFLGSGVTSASFHDRGRRCSLNDALRILHTGKAIRSAYSRRSQLGILSGPHDLEGLSFDSTFKTRSFIQDKAGDGARQTILFKRLEECFVYRAR